MIIIIVMSKVKVAVMVIVIMTVEFDCNLNHDIKMFTDTRAVLLIYYYKHITW